MKSKLSKTSKTMSFYAEPDVQAALERATESGKVRLTWIINQSIRAWADSNGYTRKSDGRGMQDLA